MLSTVRDVCATLAHAQRHEVVHGNLRPANILFTATDDVKLTDFGLHEHDINVTNFRYQFAAGMRPREADLYAAGVILHEMLFGAAPVLRQGVFAPGPGAASLPADVHRLLTRLLARESGDRFAGPDEVVRAIDRIMGGVHTASPDRKLSGRRYVLAVWLGVGMRAILLLTAVLTYKFYR